MHCPEAGEFDSRYWIVVYVIEESCPYSTPTVFKDILGEGRTDLISIYLGGRVSDFGLLEYRTVIPTESRCQLIDPLSRVIIILQSVAVSDPSRLCNADSTRAFSALSILIFRRHKFI